METAFRLLDSKAGELGMKVSFIGIDQLKELEREFGESRKRGNQAVYKRYLDSFEFHPPSELAEAKSIAIIAHPERISQVYFEWLGEMHQTILPPTYLARGAKTRVNELLTDSLGKSGHRWAPTKLPLKFLAVKSGLGRYGRNNICYISEFGSFARLEAVYTNLPFSGPLRSVQALDSCNTCYACMGNCPTGSIRPDCTIIEAGRCLTYLNETPGDFPEWIMPEWHHALFGCIRCQEICPENRKMIETTQTYASFTEEETRLILSVPFSCLPPLIADKLTAFCPPEDYETFVRNLRLLLPKE